MATLVHFVDVRRLFGNAPRCDDGAGVRGRACKGTCTCVARVICGHGPDCDGACEGGSFDADVLKPGPRFTAFDRYCHRIVLTALGAWCLVLAICAGAALNWVVKAFAS